MKTFRIAVTGGRDHEITAKERAELYDILARSDLFYREVVLLHGGCRGVDQEAARLAEEWGFPVVPFEAPWSQLSGAAAAAYAGPLRNWIMVKAADLLVAFPGGRGTANCVRQARELGVEVVEVER